MFCLAAYPYLNGGNFESIKSFFQPRRIIGKKGGELNANPNNRNDIKDLASNPLFPLYVMNDISVLALIIRTRGTNNAHGRGRGYIHDGKTRGYIRTVIEITQFAPSPSTY